MAILKWNLLPIPPKSGVALRGFGEALDEKLVYMQSFPQLLPRVIPIQPRSPLQVAPKANLGYSGQTWAGLGPSLQAEWNAPLKGGQGAFNACMLAYLQMLPFYPDLEEPLTPPPRYIWDPVIFQAGYIDGTATVEEIPIPLPPPALVNMYYYGAGAFSEFNYAAAFLYCSAPYGPPIVDNGYEPYPGYPDYLFEPKYSPTQKQYNRSAMRLCGFTTDTNLINIGGCDYPWDIAGLVTDAWRTQPTLSCQIDFALVKCAINISGATTLFPYPAETHYFTGCYKYRDANLAGC
jgi:hypothetical protein